MKAPHEKGVANHSAPSSARDVARNAENSGETMKLTADLETHTSRIGNRRFEIASFTSTDHPMARGADNSRLLGFGSGGGRKGLQQLFLAVDERVGVVGGDFKIVAMGNRVAGARFHAVSAEDATVVVDVINLGIAFRGADAVIAGILGGLDVNAICRASRRAKEAGDAFFQTVFVAAQDMDATVAIFKVHGFGGIILGHRGSEHHLEGGGKSLRQRHRRIGHFPDNVWHSPSMKAPNRVRPEASTLTLANSIADGLMPVKFADPAALVTSKRLIFHPAARFRATPQPRGESKRQGRGVLVRTAARGVD